MALISEEIAWVERITREPYASVASRASSLNEAQETLLLEDIQLWASEQNSLDLRLNGGSGGVILDTAPLLADIFYRVRRILGYPFIAYDLSGPSLELIELEVGQNFS
jgi:hypothetical protein